MKKNRIIILIVILSLLMATATACATKAAPTTAATTAPATTAATEAPVVTWVPEKPIEFVVPFSAGGGSDVFARTIVKIITDNKLCPVTINVVNKSGGGGSIGYSYMGLNVGNPYFMATTSSSYYTTPLMGGSTVSLDDFTHLAHLAIDPLILVVNADSGIKNFEEFIAYGKANPGKLNAGGASMSSDDAIACYTLIDKSGLEMSYVPFNSGAEVLAGILGNHIDMAFLSLAECAEQVEAGMLVPIANTSNVRLENLPDVPSFKEKGMDVNIATSRGVVAPKDLKPEVVAYYEELILKVSETQEWKDFIASNSMQLDYKNSADFTKYSYELNAIYDEYTKDLKKQ